MSFRKNRELSMLNKTVFQSNELISACKEMNTSSYRLFLFALQAVKPYISDEVEHDNDFPRIRIPIKDLINAFEGNSTGPLWNVLKHTKTAFDCSIVIYHDDGGFTLRHIYEEMEYKKNDALYVQFDRKMRPYLLDLVNKAYTKFAMKDTFVLESVYAWRLCELMLQYQGYFRKVREPYRDFTMKELRFALGVGDNLYKDRINNFKKRVLDEPIAEINKKTSLNMRYEVQKEGRRVVGFRIYMMLKDGETVPTVGESDREPPAIEAEAVRQKPTNAAPAGLPAGGTRRERIVETLKEAGLTLVQINSLLKKWPIDDVEESYRIAIEHARTSHVPKEKRTGYIKGCIEKNVAAGNRREAEIVQREQDAIAEKKQKEREMAEAFKSIGMSSDEPRGKGLEHIHANVPGSTAEKAEEEKPVVNLEPLSETELKKLYPFIDVVPEPSGEALDRIANHFQYKNWAECLRANWKAIWKHQKG